MKKTKTKTKKKQTATILYPSTTRAEASQFKGLGMSVIWASERNLIERELVFEKGLS